MKEAAEFYSLALKLGMEYVVIPEFEAEFSEPDNPILYSNRSAAYFSLGRHNDSLEDSEKTIQLHSDWYKVKYIFQGHRNSPL
jgi:hypothetical protein